MADDHGGPERLEQLEARLARLEQRLDRLFPDLPPVPASPLPAPPQRPVTPPTSPPVSPGFRPVNPTVSPTAYAPPPVVQPTPVAPIQPLQHEALARMQATRAPQTVAAPPQAKREVFKPLPAAPVKPASNFRWENFLGTKGLAAAGALIVIIGVIFFLKYAVEQGWIGHLPPAFRCIAAAAFGLGLMGLGEYLRKKISTLASAGITAAGLACTYASTYAAYGYFTPPLLGTATAFILLALVSALGIVVSVRARLASVAAISLVGAYLAPMLMRVENPNPLVFATYSLALLGTGLWLRAWLRGSFIWVGRMVWWATMLVGGTWAARVLYTQPVLVIAYALAVWSMIHASHIIAARGQDVPEQERDKPAPATTLAQLSSVFSSFSVSAWATLLMVLALRQVNPAIDWIAPCGMTGVTLTLAVWLAGDLRVLRDAPRNDRERLGAGLMVQSASALIAAVALATVGSGTAAVIIWLAMGLAAVAAARWMRALSLTIYGMVLMTIGTGRLILWDSWNASLFSGGALHAGLYWSAWTGYAALTGLAWLGAAALLAWGTERSRILVTGVLCSIFGAGMMMAAVVHPDAEMMSIVMGWLVSAAVLGAAHRIMPQLGWKWISLGMLGAASLATLVIVPSQSGGFHVFASLLGLEFTRYLVTCVVVAGAWLLMMLVFRRSIGVRKLGRFTTGLCGWMCILMLAAAPLSPHHSVGTVAWAWGVVALVAVGLTWLEERVGLLVGAVLAGCGACLLWTVQYVFHTPSEWTLEWGMLMHPGFLGSLVIAAGLLATWRLARPAGGKASGKGKIETGELHVVAAILAGILLWASTSFEAGRSMELLAGEPRVRGATVSVWWGLVAIVLLMCGFRRHVPPVRYVGLTLLFAAGLKVVLWDMADAPQLARVISFIVLGLLMLATAVGYAKVARTLEAARTKPE